MSTHYIAHVKIEKVEKPDTGSRQAEPKREISEVTQLTIKASTLPALIGRVQGHLGLVEED